jgi:trigger factor
MPNTVNTTLTELPDSRVRVEVQVAAEEIEKQLERKAGELGRQLKMPGFRKGKVPAALVIQRLGREYVLDETVRGTLPNWYEQAIKEAGILPIGDPELDLADLPAHGENFEFSIEIGVLPKAKLGDYKGLEVGRGEVLIADEQIAEELAKLRERMAKLESVEEPARVGDFVVIDYVGSIDGELFEGGEGRDQLVELGGGNLIDGFEEGLIGSSTGEEHTIEVTFPEDYTNEDLAGKPASFAVSVKDVKAKELPVLDDDFAADIGFDTLEDLRNDISGRLSDVEQARIDSVFREAALDAAVAKAQIDVPEALIQARANEMWERTLHSLSHRGVSKEMYLQIASQSEENVLAEITPEAEQAIRREALLSAIVAAEEIEPSEQDLLEALAPSAEREGLTAEKLLEKLRSADRVQDITMDLAARQAVELIADGAKPIALAQAQAREKLWTPEQEPQTAAAAGGLWTPES